MIPTPMVPLSTSPGQEPGTDITHVLPLTREEHLPGLGNTPMLGDNPELALLVSRAFGWKAVKLARGGENVMEIAACQKGNKIVLLPHFSYGPGASPEDAAAITASLMQQGYRCEWRHTAAFCRHIYEGKVSSLLALEPGISEQLQKLPAGVRHKIRKCEANGTVVEKAGREALDVFYRIYSGRMHELGSPALPKRWFVLLMEEYRNGDISLWIAKSGDKVLGTAIMLSYKGFYEACWVATDKAGNRLYTAYGLYWAMMSHAIAGGGKVFSFGRSTRNGGVHRFKQQWGTEDLPLVWNYSHPGRHNIRKHRWLARAWALLPYPLARAAGPFFAARVY